MNHFELRLIYFGLGEHTWFTDCPGNKWSFNYNTSKYNDSKNGSITHHNCEVIHWYWEIVIEQWVSMAWRYCAEHWDDNAVGFRLALICRGWFFVLSKLANIEKYPNFVRRPQRLKLQRAHGTLVELFLYYRTLACHNCDIRSWFRITCEAILWFDILSAGIERNWYQ